MYCWAHFADYNLRLSCPVIACSMTELLKVASPSAGQQTGQKFASKVYTNLHKVLEVRRKDCRGRWGKPGKGPPS